MVFNNAQNCNFGDVTVNSIQGDFIQHVAKEENQILELCSRLSKNFDNEPYYSIRHAQNLRKATEGTCKWLSQSKAFTQWRDVTLTKQPVLWVHGTPGSGKSTLCSQAIRLLPGVEAGGVVAYHFCDFARQHKEIEILSMLACQLLHATLSEAPGELPPLPNSVASLTPLQLKEPDNLYSIINQLVHRPTKAIVYFVLDGVDEELRTRSRWSEGILPVLQFLVALARDFPQHVRLWVSSQRREEIRNLLTDFESIDIVPFARDDIELYLAKMVYGLQGPKESDQKILLESLQDGAEGSFMWARLMVDELSQRSTLASMKEFIKEGFPRSLNDYYQRIFEGYPAHLRPLACQIFSLLVYAKRPLRFCELWEAVWCLSSSTEGMLDPDEKPWKSHLDAVFQPFVELIPIHPTGDKLEKLDESQFTCHLIHSTLKDFLIDQKSILCTEQFDFKEVHICPELAVKACLGYLLQSRFSDLLQKNGDQWHDTSGTPVMNNRFLIYAAKYWDKHLDTIEHPEQQRRFIPKVVSFVKSPNFWTVIQVQSIWVQAQFSSFVTKDDDDTKWLRRMFPVWFKEAEEGFQVWTQNRSFLRQWRYLLSHHTSPCTGEVDHIWTGALGRNHFLAGRKSRVVSFAIAPDRMPGDRVECTMFFTDLINDSGGEIYTLEISYDHLPECSDRLGGALTSADMMQSATTLRCRSRTWEIQNSTSDPTLKQEQILQVSAGSCDFDLYVHDPTNPYAQTDRAPLAAFLGNGNILRIGSRIFERDSSSRLIPVPDIHSEESHMASRKARYVEEVSRHGHILAVTSRMKLSNQDVDCLLEDIHDYELDSQHSIDSGEDTDGSDDDTDNSDSDDCSDHAKDKVFASDDDSASEGSSVASIKDKFEDDEIAPWDDPEDGYSNDSESGDESSDDDELAVETDSSDSEEEAFKRPSPPKPHGQVPQEEDEDEDGEEEDIRRYFRDQKPASHSKPRATISIFDTKYGESTLLFSKQVRLKCKLWASPPVFHPSKPLLVWPLGDGQILFVDYDRGSSFTRTLRPSTPFTRHVAIHCTFSTCGQFMHIAALEGRLPDRRLAAVVEKLELPLPPVHMAMLISTYRLSSTKPTRAPPALIHRIRIDLKEVKGINTRQLPFNLTWAEDYLYVTGSWKLLQVWRIPLFSDRETEENIKEDEEANASGDDSQLVMAPEKMVFMPKTCGRRLVRFFPSVAGEAPVPPKIVVGHEASVFRGQLSQFRRCPNSESRSIFFDPPVVCYLDEEKNLGNWVDSKSRTKTMENLGIGSLDVPIEGVERFNPEDDCELEPYYY